MPILENLSSFHIIELDKNNKSFITWTYPTISEPNKNLIMSKSFLNINKTENFTYLRNKNDWIYITITDNIQNLNIKSFGLILIANNYNPDKYLALSRVLSKCYSKTGSPVELVKIYLSIYTTGSCSTLENGTFFLKDFDSISNTSIKMRELITMFGLEIILLYTGILLKKKVVIYHHTQDILLKWLPTITNLMLHRNPNTYLFPVVDMKKDELNELKSKEYFVAGFTDSAICTNSKFYDLLVNIAASEISISPHAKDSLMMTKMHKDIALFLVQLTENQNLTEVQLVSEITNKTNELLNFIKNNDIKSKELNPALENFLLNVASAENLFIV